MMFQRLSDSKSESDDRLRQFDQSPGGELASAAASNNISGIHNGKIRRLSGSTTKQNQFQGALASTFFSAQGGSHIEESKSPRIRGGYHTQAAAQKSVNGNSRQSDKDNIIMQSSSSSGLSNPNQRTHPSNPQFVPVGSTNRTITAMSDPHHQHDHQNHSQAPSLQHGNVFASQQRTSSSARSESNSESPMMKGSSSNTNIGRSPQRGNNISSGGNSISKQRAASTSAIMKSQSHQLPREEFKTTSLTSGVAVGNGLSSSHHFQQDTTRFADDVATMIKEELENELDGLRREEELIQHKQQHPPEIDQQDDNLSSFDRDLPVELAFLIRQQAFCMARMNYLDRQIRELKESRSNATSSGSSAAVTPVALHNQTPTNHQHLESQYAQHQQQAHYNHQTFSSTAPNYQYHNQQYQAYQHQQLQSHRTSANLKVLNGQLPHHNVPTASHGKTGNFILSDDSGGEYSRATISDDDELSSLLDQIAKSVRPDRGSANVSMLMNTNHNSSSIHSNNQPPQHQTPHRSNYHPQHLQQQYTILNPNQIHHHQAVPVFVMSSPIAVAHPSSISSTVLPGVHFQPEPRYNQYYEDFYTPQNANLNNQVAGGSSFSMMHQQHQQQLQPNRSQQLDCSLSAIEQLVSRKEKRLIKSQLRSADNWLKMRSLGLCNVTTNLSETNFASENNNGKANGPKLGTNLGVEQNGETGCDDVNNGLHEAGNEKLATSSSSTTTTASAPENSS